MKAIEFFFKENKIWGLILPRGEGAHGGQGNALCEAEEGTDGQQSKGRVAGGPRGEEGGHRPEGHSPSHYSFPAISVHQRPSDEGREYVSP